MNNQEFISKMIRINQHIQTPSKIEKMAYERYKDHLIEEYFCSVNEECIHDHYEHESYFFDTKLKECAKEIAGFRLVTCQTCHKQIWLSKTSDPNWDVTIGNRIVDVLERSKIKCKR